MPGPIPRTVEKASAILLKEAKKVGDCLVIEKRASKQAGHAVISVMGKPRPAHRVVYEAHHGPIPEGMIVMHSCDVPRCVNINHLSLGTLSDNMKDMWNKQRGVIGESHGNSKFSEADIDFIRTNTHISGAELGRMYSCSPNTIYAIRNRRSWNHV